MYVYVFPVRFLVLLLISLFPFKGIIMLTGGDNKDCLRFLRIAQNFLKSSLGFPQHVLE